MLSDAGHAIHVATTIGENALAVFGAALVLLLVIVSTVWLTVHRYYIRRYASASAAGPRAFTALSITGLIVIIVAVLLLATAPNWIIHNGTVALIDQALTSAISRTIELPVLQLAAAVTVLADTPVLWLLGISGSVVLLWRRDYLLAAAWAIAIAGNGTLTRLMKGVFARPRPTYDHDLLVVQGWSFPSGHASGAVVAYGMLAYVLIRHTPVIWHLPILLIAITTAFITGCSRIFLQVHYTSDVLVGALTGLAWLAVCVLGVEFGSRIAKRRRDEQLVREL